MSHCFNWLNQLGISSFLLEGLFWIGLVIVAVYLIGRWLSSFTYSDYRETPLEILQKEFARGNITEEYLIRKKISLVIKKALKTKKRKGGIVIKNLLKMMKPFDIIIIFLLVALSFSPMAIYSVQNSQNEGDKIYAVISIDGEEVDRFLLTGNKENKLITYYPAPGKYNIIEIDGERIRNKEDNSPQQISVQTGWIQNPGETSLNIPHRLLIEINSENPEDTEIDVIS